MKRKKLENIYANSRPTEIQHSYADISKAKNILGYNPEYSIKEGLTELISWYTKNKNLL